MDKFDGTGLPYGPVQSMEQVFHDPQVINNGMIQEIVHSTAGNIRVPGKCWQGRSQPSSCGGAELHFLPSQLIRIIKKNIN